LFKPINPTVTAAMTQGTDNAVLPDGATQIGNECNGADVIVQALTRHGIRICFSNPGTTELDLVGALSQHSAVRYVPTLFEGVAIGAADGYYRISRQPAAALVHTAVGLANALSSLLNAQKAGSAFVVLVGDHPDPLQPYMDVIASGANLVQAAASYVSWVRRIPSSDAIEQTISDAIAAAMRAPGGPAVVAAPADVAWKAAGRSDRKAEHHDAGRTTVSEARVAEIATLVGKGRRTALVLGSQCTSSEAGLMAAGRIAAATGCRLLSRAAVTLRGAGRVAIELLPYPPLLGADALSEIDDVVLAGAHPPITPWAYPGREGVLMTPAGSEINVLASPEEDAVEALTQLADALGAGPPVLQEHEVPDLATGEIHPEALARSVAALLPEGAIVLDESVTSGRSLYARSAGSLPHTWLSNLGGAIGWGQAAAIGCSLAEPSRKVVVLQGDGAAMYMPQSLWTIARERLNVLCVIFSNRSYKVLENDMAIRDVSLTHLQGKHPMRIDNPGLDWVGLAQALGVDAVRVADMSGFNRAFEDAASAGGPSVLVVEF
jgi:acetolactate synthase I/II/III large subunit